MAVMNYFLKSKKVVGSSFVSQDRSTDGCIIFEYDGDKIFAKGTNIYAFEIDTTNKTYRRITGFDTFQIAYYEDDNTITVIFGGTARAYHNVRWYEPLPDMLANDNYSLNLSNFPRIDTNMHLNSFLWGSSTNSLMYLSNDSIINGTHIEILHPQFFIYDNFDFYDWNSDIDWDYYHYNEVLTSFNSNNNISNSRKHANYQEKTIPEPVPPEPEFDEYYTSNLKLAMLGNCVDEYNARWS